MTLSTNMQWAGARRLGFVVCAVLIAVPTATAQTPPNGPSARGWKVPRTPDGRPDLEGVWTNMTATPLQRPREFGDKSHFTKVEAAEYARTWLERLVQEEDEEDRTGADLNELYLDDRVVVPDLRTSLIVDPPTGRLPPFVKAAQDRLDARPRGNYDDPRGTAARGALHSRTRWRVGAHRTDRSQHVLGKLLPDRADADARHDLYRADTRRADYPDRRRARLREDPTVARRFDRPMGGRHARRGYDQHQYEGRLPRRYRAPHVVERFTRAGPSTVTYRATVDDPDTWPVPWTLEFPFEASRQRLFEYACHEGNYAVEGVLRGARADEKAGRKR